MDTAIQDSKKRLWSDKNRKLVGKRQVAFLISKPNRKKKKKKKGDN